MEHVPSPTPKLIPLPCNRQRVKCLFCGVSLISEDFTTFAGLNVCGSDGLLVMTCREHATIGDLMVQTFVAAAKESLKRTNGLFAEKMTDKIIKLGKGRHQQPEGGKN